MPPMVMPPYLGLQAAIPDHAAHGERGDDLHDGQEERRKPGRPVADSVHARRSGFSNSLRFSCSRPSALTTRTPVIFSLYAPVILELILRTGGYCDHDAFLELHRDDQQHGEWRTDDQRQPPVDDRIMK